MADIAFLLIVYFMVTTTFTATRGLDFALPEEDDTPPVIEKEAAGWRKSAAANKHKTGAIKSPECLTDSVRPAAKPQSSSRVIDGCSV